MPTFDTPPFHAPQRVRGTIVLNSGAVEVTEFVASTTSGDAKIEHTDRDGNALAPALFDVVAGTTPGDSAIELTISNAIRPVSATVIAHVSELGEVTVTINFSDPA